MSLVPTFQHGDGFSQSSHNSRYIRMSSKSFSPLQAERTTWPLCHSIVRWRGPSVHPPRERIVFLWELPSLRREKRRAFACATARRWRTVQRWHSQGEGAGLPKIMLSARHLWERGCAHGSPLGGASFPALPLPPRPSHRGPYGRAQRKIKVQGRLGTHVTWLRERGRWPASRVYTRTLGRSIPLWKYPLSRPHRCAEHIPTNEPQRQTAAKSANPEYSYATVRGRDERHSCGCPDEPSTAWHCHCTRVYATCAKIMRFLFFFVIARWFSIWGYLLWRAPA